MNIMYFHLVLRYAYNQLKRDYIPIGRQAGSRARQTVWTEGSEQEVAWLRIELSNYSADCQVSRCMYIYNRLGRRYAYDIRVTWTRSIRRLSASLEIAMASAIDVFLRRGFDHFDHFADRTEITSSLQFLARTRISRASVNPSQPTATRNEI